MNGLDRVKYEQQTNWFIACEPSYTRQKKKTISTHMILHKSIVPAWFSLILSLARLLFQWVTVMMSTWLNNKRPPHEPTIFLTCSWIKQIEKKAYGKHTSGHAINWRRLMCERVCFHWSQTHIVHASCGCIAIKKPR